MDLSTSTSRLGVPTDAAVAQGITVCGDCIYAESHRASVGVVCRHPSREYSDHVMFGGEQACRAFAPRRAGAPHHLFSSHNI